jgi:hypothetical protein
MHLPSANCITQHRIKCRYALFISALHLIHTQMPWISAKENKNLAWV